MIDGSTGNASDHTCCWLAVVVAEKSVARGWAMFFNIMAVISINLGLMNLLPVPVLDGGHLLFFAAEGLGRRPIPLRVREYANVFGLVLCSC